MKKFDKIIVVIPAYQPDKKLIKLIEELLRNTFYSIVVINDGSDTIYNAIFDQIASMKVPVISHDENLGKGESLKTGFKYIDSTFSKYIGIITVDCDGQHSIWDVKTVAVALKKNKNKMVLGIRDFKNPDVPVKSKFGNFFAKSFFQILTGENLSDVQTGLRGIPKKLVLEMIDIPGSKFDYESNVLFAMHKKGIPIVQVPIITTYYNKNKDSHFKPIQDGLNVAGSFVKNIFKK